MFYLLLAAIWVAAFVWVRLRRRRAHPTEDFTRDLLCVVGLAALAVGFFWRPILAGDVWMPADGGDLGSFLYPTYRFAAQSLHQGVLPLWNPHLYGGLPFIGDIQSGLLYPVYLLYYLLTPELTYRGLEGLSVFHIFLAGAGMYACLRFLRRREAAGGRLRRLACLVGAVAFMFSDLFIVHFGNLNMIAVAAWLPLIYLAFQRALSDRRPWLAAGSGALFAVATLAGHIQITLFIAIVLGLRALWELGREVRLGRGGRAAWPLLYLALTGLVTLGLSAPALLPFFRHIAFTERAAWSYGQTVKYSLAPGQFVSLLVPGFLGRGPAFHWGLWDRVEVGYIGIFPLMLAGVGVLTRRERTTRFLLALTGFAFLLAMGLYALLHGWLYQLVPGFDQVRAPARFVLALDFGLAGLAAIGLDALLRPLGRTASRAYGRLLRVLPALSLGAAGLLWGVVYLSLLQSQDKDPSIFARLSVAANGVGLFVVFVLLGLALLWARRHGRLRSAVLGWLSLALIFFDLSSTGSYNDLGTSDPTAGFGQTAIVQFLQKDPTPFRIDARTEIDAFWQPDTALVHGLDDVWGIVNPVTLRDAARYWSELGSRSTPLYDALNVKYVIARKDVVLDWDKFELAFDGDPNLNVYRNLRVLPRAWVAGQTQAVGSSEEAWAAIHAAGFDPGLVAVLEGARQGAQDAGSLEHTAQVTRLSSNRLRIDVQTNRAGVLVLSEMYYPGWKARVNGQAAPIWRADAIFQALAVPAGASQVELVYAPLEWWIGLGLTGVTLVGLLAGGLWARRRARQH